MALRGLSVVCVDSFDNYQSLISHGENWPYLQKIFGDNRSRTTAKLKEIRSIRNALFYFKRAITIQDHETLGVHLDWLRNKIRQAAALRRQAHNERKTISALGRGLTVPGNASTEADAYLAVGRMFDPTLKHAKTYCALTKPALQLEMNSLIGHRRVFGDCGAIRRYYRPKGLALGVIQAPSRLESSSLCSSFSANQKCRGCQDCQSNDSRSA